MYRLTEELDKDIDIPVSGNAEEAAPSEPNGEEATVEAGPQETEQPRTTEEAPPMEMVEEFKEEVIVEDEEPT